MQRRNVLLRGKYNEPYSKQGVISDTAMDMYQTERYYQVALWEAWDQMFLGLNTYQRLRVRTSQPVLL